MTRMLSVTSFYFRTATITSTTNSAAVRGGTIPTTTTPIRSSPHQGEFYVINNNKNFCLRKFSSCLRYKSRAAPVAESSVSTSHRWRPTVSPMTSSLSVSSLLQPSMIQYHHHQQQQHYHAKKIKSLSYSSTRTIADIKNNTNMADEYSATATMEEMSFGDTCIVPNFTLESGVTLPTAQIRYRTYGVPPQTTKETSNVIVICHALTGNASIDTWWSTLLGPNKAFDTDQYHIICCNILGSCYGSTSPISINPDTNQPYGIDFPSITVQDTVRLQLECLQQHLGFQSIQCVIGGSFGGMQTLEYAILGNDIPTATTAVTPYIKSIIPIACNAQHSAWQIAISEIQRQMIYNDVHWSTHQQYHLATSGLQLARQMAMISYRTAIGYSNKFNRRTTPKMTTGKSSSETTNDTIVPQWEVSNYLKYQGEKFVQQRQFDPITYVKLTQQMDTHDICRNRIVDQGTTKSEEENVASILQQITIPTLVLGIDSDILYPIKEQELLAKYIPNSQFYTIHSIEGHDGFLIEQQQVGTHIQNFLSSL